jgi:GLPGLI family protein
MRNVRIMLAIILILNGMIASAQKTDKALVAIKYELKHVIDTTQRDYPLVRPFMLVVGKDLSYYEDYYNVMIDQGTPVITTFVDNEGKLRKSIMGGTGDVYVKNLPENKMTTITFAGSANYAIEGAMPDLKWTISTEQKTLLSYKCQKATTTFKGRNYTAWFTDQLPYRTGPWKLGGLPGLILDASDDTNEVIFTTTEIITAPNFKPIQVPSDAIPADIESVNKIKEAVEKNRNAFSGAAITRPSNITATSVPITGGPSGRPPRKFSNPIEKEEVKKK